MDLLEKHKSNLRYYLQTTDANNVYIAIECFDYKIDEQSTTELETNHLIEQKRYSENYIDYLTVCKTVEENELTIDVMYDDIVKYLAGKDVNQITIRNYSIKHDKFVLESRVFKAITDASKNIIIDLWASALRISSDEYREIDSIKFLTGTLLVESDCVLKSNTMYFEDFTIDCFNSNDTKEKSFYCNFMVEEKLNVVNLSIYSTLKLNLIGTCRDFDKYENSKCMIENLHIFGSEFISKDAKNPRIEIKCFKSAIIDKLDIDDDVIYGTLFKLDKDNVFTINEIARNIKTISEGSMFIIGSIAIVSLHHVDTIIDKESTLRENFSFVNFLKDDSGLKRKVYIYDTYVENKSPIPIYLCKLRNVEIEMISIFGSKFVSNVNILDYNDTVKLNKFYFADNTIEYTGDFILSKANKLTFDKNTIKANDIKFDSPKISLSDGTWNFNNMILSNEEQPIKKISFKNMKFEGKSIICSNPNIIEDYHMNFYDNNSYYKLDLLDISGYNPSFIGSILETKKFKFYNDKVCKFINTYLGFPSTKEVKIETEGSLSCNFIFNTKKIEEVENKLIFNIKDKYKFITCDKFDFIGAGTEMPRIDFVTNKPFNLDATGFDKKHYFHVSMSEDYDSKKEITLQFLKSESQTDDDLPIVLNDSEKIAILSKSKDPEFDQTVYKLYRK